MYIFYENYSQIFAGDLSAIDIALQGCFANIFQTFFAEIWVNYYRFDAKRIVHIAHAIRQICNFIMDIFFL